MICISLRNANTKFFKNTEMELFLNAIKFLKTKCRLKKQINKIKLILFKIKIA